MEDEGGGVIPIRGDQNFKGYRKGIFVKISDVKSLFSAIKKHQKQSSTAAIAINIEVLANQN